MSLYNMVIQRLESGIRKTLVERAIEMFGIEGYFDVPKQTVFSRIASERLEVWHPGTESPLLEVEVVLISFLFTAHRLCCPLSVGDTIALMNVCQCGLLALTILQNGTQRMNSIWDPANIIPGSLSFQLLTGRTFRYCLLPIQRHR